jgi:hypothetical protein
MGMRVGQRLFVSERGLLLVNDVEDAVAVFEFVVDGGHGDV